MHTPTRVARLCKVEIEKIESRVEWSDEASVWAENSDYF